MFIPKHDDFELCVPFFILIAPWQNELYVCVRRDAPLLHDFTSFNLGNCSLYGNKIGPRGISALASALRGNGNLSELG